jgi:hypothetical protein
MLACLTTTLSAAEGGGLSAQQQSSALQNQGSVNFSKCKQNRGGVSANLTIRSSLRSIHILPHKRSSSRVRRGTLQGSRGLSFALQRLAVEGLAGTALAIRRRKGQAPVLAHWCFKGPGLESFAGGLCSGRKKKHTGGPWL